MKRMCYKCEFLREQDDTVDLQRIDSKTSKFICKDCYNKETNNLIEFDLKWIDFAFTTYLCVVKENLIWSMVAYDDILKQLSWEQYFKLQAKAIGKVLDKRFNIKKSWKLKPYKRQEKK